MAEIPFPVSGLGPIVDQARRAAADARADCPSYPDHVSSGHALRLADVVDPLVRHVIDVTGALQHLAGVLTMDGAPAAPCANCLIPATQADELPPGVPYTVMADGGYHYRACACVCHENRINWYNQEVATAKGYVGRVLQGLYVGGPNPNLVGHLSAYLWRMAEQCNDPDRPPGVPPEVDRAELEKIVEWLTLTNPHFRAMLTTLCDAAVYQARTLKTVKAAAAFDKAQKRDVLLKEIERGTTRILTRRDLTGPDRGAGGPDPDSLPVSG